MMPRTEFEWNQSDILEDVFMSIAVIDGVTSGAFIWLQLILSFILCKNIDGIFLFMN